MKKIIYVIIALAGVIFSENVRAQGPCFANGGEVSIGGTIVFFCPYAGMYTPCAYNCGKQDQ